MACPALWNSTSDESVLSNVLPKIGLTFSTEESQNKDAECIFCNGKFSKDEQGEIWIRYFSWTSPEQRTQSISMTFINRLEAEMLFA